LELLFRIGGSGVSSAPLGPFTCLAPRNRFSSLHEGRGPTIQPTACVPWGYDAVNELLLLQIPIACPILVFTCKGPQPTSELVWEPERTTSPVTKRPKSVTPFKSPKSNTNLPRCVNSTHRESFPQGWRSVNRQVFQTMIARVDEAYKTPIGPSSNHTGRRAPIYQASHGYNGRQGGPKQPPSGPVLRMPAHPPRGFSSHGIGALEHHSRLESRPEVPPQKCLPSVNDVCTLLPALPMTNFQNPFKGLWTGPVSLGPGPY